MNGLQMLVIVIVAVVGFFFFLPAEPSVRGPGDKEISEKSSKAYTADESILFVNVVAHPC